MTKDFIFDLYIDSKTKISPKIWVVKGDANGNRFLITLKDKEGFSDKVVDLTDSSMVTLVFSKSDGNVVVGNAVITDPAAGKFEYTIKGNEISFEGEVECEVQVYGSDSRYTTSRFTFEVKESLDNGEAVESTTEYPVLMNLISTVENIAANEGNRINSEIDREDKEALRVTKENERISAETNRQSREDQRIQDENIRKANETLRNQKESERLTKELERITAETDRVANEIIRIANENERNILKTQLDTLKTNLETLKAELEAIPPPVVAQPEEPTNPDILVWIDTDDDGAMLDFTTLATKAEVNAVAARVTDAETDLITLNGEVDIANQNLVNHDAKDATTLQKGHVQLTTDTDSTSEIMAPTASALKEVKDSVAMHLADYATKQKPFQYDPVAQEYINIGKYWDSLRTGKIYTVEFNQFDVSPSPLGIKKHDNEGLVCEPSTNTIRGRNDYENIGLFMSIDVNAYVDENDDYHVIAIKGDGRFKNDGTMGDVYVMAMPGYQKRYETDTVWGISYSDTMHPGFEILDEAVKPDGTIRPFLLHAKYVAGRNPHENNNLASISGVSPEYADMSHNGQITEFKKKGVQYSGKTSHDDYYVQLMMWLKYATTHSQSIMYGASSYYLQYTNLVPEAGVKRVIITNAQANNLLVGSCVSIGDYGDGTISADRNSAQNYNLANRVNIIDIVDLGDGNSAVYVDSPSIFDTTLTTTITTYPWYTGSCDNVLGQDGSPNSNTSGKEPFVINGIEMMIGGYEVLQNLIVLNNAADNRIDVYANYDCTTYATSVTSAYDLVGQLAQTNNSWKYGSKMVIPRNHPSVILITEAEASSTTGTGDGIYTNPPSAGGTRVWRSLGALDAGSLGGFRCLNAYVALSSAYWNILGRLSATGRSRRRAGVN